MRQLYGIVNQKYVLSIYILPYSFLLGLGFKTFYCKKNEVEMFFYINRGLKRENLEPSNYLLAQVVL